MENRKITTSIRMYPEDKEAITKAAQSERLTVSTYIVRTVLAYIKSEENKGLEGMEK